MTNHPPPINVPSLILRNDENEQLFKLLGKGCLTLSTGVVQVLLAQPNPQKWTKKCTGVACFVKDNSKRSYYIRVYDLRFGQLTWEQELYTQFKYITTLPYFHTFSTDNYQAGLNFADEQEATRFAKALQSKLRERQNRRTEKRRQNQSATSATIPTAPTTAGIPLIESKPTSVKVKEKKSKKKQKLTKADIGLPSDFQHIAHVGWDPDKGFDMNNLDPNLKALFQKIGVSEEKLKDEDTRNFIYSFIAKQGGMEAVKREVSTVKPARPPARPQPPPVPSRDPPTSSRDVAPPPPPPPARNNDRGFPPPPPSISKSHAPAGPRAPPPPPPSRDTTRPSSKMPQPPRPPQKTTGNAPPPPPPPPPGPLLGGPSSPPPPPEKTGPPLPEVPDSRTALLSQIQGFKGAGTLKHVSEDKRSVGGDDRGTLMDEIRRGAKLHPASDRPDAPPPHDEEPSDGLAGALMLALKQREKAIQNYESSSGSEEDEDDEEDEWSD